MRQVWKFPVTMQDHFALAMPAGARLLAVQLQRRAPQLWALCDPTAPLEARSFRLAGTGHPITEANEDLAYVDSFQMLEEVLIFHLFEILPPKE